MWKENGGERDKAGNEGNENTVCGVTEGGYGVGSARGARGAERTRSDKVGENGNALSERGPHITGALTMYSFWPQIRSTFYQQGFQLLWRDFKNRFRQKHDC